VIGAGLVTLAVAAVFGVIGGWVGWFFALLYAALGLDVLWFCWRGYRLRRRP